MSARSNAEAVVRAWRAGGGGDPTVWGLPAARMTPSGVNRLAATAWGQIATAVDLNANRLAVEGFLPGHPIMREMRGIATDAARRHQAATAWADELEQVEKLPKWLEQECDSP